MYKTIKHIILLCFIFLLTACGSKTATTTTYNLDGIWADQYGNAIYFDSENHEYLLQTQYGRLGYGEYQPGSRPKIYYDETGYKVSYNASTKKVRLDLIGSAVNESLDGMEFKYSENYYMEDYSIHAIAGTWVNQSGTVITIDENSWTFYYQTPYETGESYIVDNVDGYGLCFEIDGYLETIGYNDDGSIYFITCNDPFFNGTFYYQG